MDKPDQALNTELRQRAEAWLQARQQQPQAELSAADTLRLMHELQVHQVELEMQNEELERQQTDLRLAAKVFEHCYDGIMVTDPDTAIVDVNPAFCRITGYAREEVLGKTPRLLASTMNGPLFHLRMWKFLHENDYWSGDVWNVRKDGELYAERLAISAVRDANGVLQQYVGVFSDISSAKKHEAELDRIANYDALTGAPNRRLFADRLNQAIARSQRSARPLAICYLDLDGFKAVNDEFGHEGGDQLLVETTRRLHGVLRTEDTVARIGGDEFVLLVDLMVAEECPALLQRLLQAVSAPLLIQGKACVISASIGVTLYPQDAADADTLLRHADQAMYRAKEQGKNRYQLFDLLHDREMQERAAQQQALALALEREEFVLYYQPKVDLLDGTVIGVEALIRWQHPQRGLLAPNAFLQYLQGNVLDRAIGEWVISAALRQQSAWRAQGLRLISSVNISPEHLLREDFAARLRLTLQAQPDVPADCLELEILESAALSDVAQAARTLAECHQLGVQLSLDDFGTGYSSLLYFRSLPIDTLKIDQSFIRNMIMEPNDQLIVEGVVRLADTFSRQVIAEGVETLAHGALLLKLGCRLCQGYGIARPMPAAALPGWIAQWQQQEHWLALGTADAGMAFGHEGNSV
ncbi:EAL domain-containing protein [Paucibacter sp. APW11]|uniref:EAL domain-containing protein n=1 Tax=Roseateles aquae TaxID=3077235 RepID=A0ABU3PF46_9BURK|nr:EAL domain-containing protein [Paucibacter sp. APW11]MDT9000980.1 EAL domain-containing protein [Paucibacter sp. APW11]